MEHHHPGSLMIVVAVAFLVPILLHRFRVKIIPVVVAEIIAGLIIGKSGFNIVSPDEWLSILSTLGFIYLMFLSGLEIDFNYFSKGKSDKKKQQFNPLLVAGFIFISILLVSYGLAQLFYVTGYIGDPFLFTLIISTISLGVVVPVLKERGLTEKPLGQTVLLITVLGDFTTMILLAIYVAYKSKGSGWESLLILILFVVVFAAYHIINWYTSRNKGLGRLTSGTIQIDTRAVFALILLFVVISETLGVESILGAFLAGVIVSLLKPKKSFVEQLDSFGYGFFIPIFFVMVGVGLDLRELLVNPRILILIPILFVSMYVAKMIPALILKRWLPWRDVISTGILISSKLSLVIAAAAIAKDLGFISSEVNGAVILVAVLTCIISPMIFSKMVPEEKQTKKKRISIVGANNITLPVSLDLKKHEDYDVTLYGSEQKKIAPELVTNKTDFPLIEVSELSKEVLEEQGAFNADLLIVATGNDNYNIDIALYAKAQGIGNVIVRVEDAQKHQEKINEGMTVFSTLYAARTLLKALTEQPSILRLITHHNELLREISVEKSKYDNLALRHLPFLGDALILQIFRNDEPIVPHGDTKLKIGDKLLVSGSKDNLDDMHKELQNY